MEYTLEFVDKLYGHEEIIEKDGAKLVIDPMAQMFLFGSEIDYEVSLLESGFKFRNPNVTETCGCGESIKFGQIFTIRDNTRKDMPHNKLIAGNWKMNGNIKLIEEFAKKTPNLQPIRQ